MSGIGYRQKGDSGPMYNPERDYAYITPTLMVTAVENLSLAGASEETQKWFSEHEITEPEIAAIAESLAAAQRDFVNAADPVATLEQALNRRGFFDHRYVVRQALFAAIGEVICGAWFKAVREVSLVGEESPAQNNMARFSTAVADFVRHAGPRFFSGDDAANRLRMRNDVLQARLNIVYKELRDTQEKLAARDRGDKLAPQKAPPKPWWQKRFLPWY